jgi:hypothetical protein
MFNTVNTGSLQGLQVGQTLLLHSRKVNGGKIQLEFAEVLNSGSNTVNPLALFNGSDDRFTSGGARRAWLTAEPKDASKYLGIDLSSANAAWTIDEMGREILPLNILNPVAKVGEELIALKVEVVETTEPTDWQRSNISTAAKRRGKDGDYITHKGMYIFANTRVAFRAATHMFLEPDAKVSVSGGITAVTSTVSDSPFN